MHGRNRELTMENFPHRSLASARERREVRGPHFQLPREESLTARRPPGFWGLCSMILTIISTVIANMQYDVNVQLAHHTDNSLGQLEACTKHGSAIREHQNSSRAFGIQRPRAISQTRSQSASIGIPSLRFSCHLHKLENNNEEPTWLVRTSP